MSYTLIISSFLFIVLLTVVYFTKKRLYSYPNRIYSIMILANLLGVILEIILDIFGSLNITDTFIIDIVMKFYLFYLVSWASLFFLYVFVISKEDKDINFNRYKKIMIVVNILTFITLLVLNIDYHHEFGGAYYSFGAASNFTYIMSGIYIIMMLGTMLLNIKKIFNKKYIPLFVFLVLGSIIMFIQYMNPELLLMTSAETYLTFLMYFTIENPDMKMIEELNVAKEAAVKANNAKSDFLSNMSHEIRTPLNAIVGFSQALESEELPPSAKEEVEDIISSAESLLEIVNGILDISKIEANRLEIINTEYSFKKVFNDLVSLTKARMGDSNLDFRYSMDSTIPPVLYGDHSRVKQVILNLLTNAVKYTKEGYLDFKVSCVVKDDICRLIISVEDSGIGIKSESLNRLFSKFERLGVEKEITIEGTGLGLAITKRLVDLMKGQIVVQSIYGKGSKFTIALDQKIVEGKEEIEEETDSGSFKNIDCSTKKILIVDDNKINLKVASKLLSEYSASIDTVISGQECINKINLGDKYDLILMDDMMPKMSGVETLHKLKENPEFRIPVVALTANAISGMREKYLQDGFDEYLAKPIQKSELNKIIDKFLQQK